MLGRNHDQAAASFYNTIEHLDKPSFYKPPLTQIVADVRRQNSYKKADPTFQCHDDYDDLELKKKWQCAQIEIQHLKRSLCELQTQLKSLKPQLDPKCVQTMEAITNLLICAIRKATGSNNLGALALLPEILSVLDSNILPFRSLELQRERMHRVLTDHKVTSSSWSYSLSRLTGAEAPSDVQTELITRLINVECSFDAKYLAVATGDEKWCGLKHWWDKSPLSLRWITVTTAERHWLAYVDLYCRSPPDLRWLAVHFQDTRWLHFCTTWKSISTERKLRAIACEDLTFLRTEEYVGPRFELWDCPANNEMYLVPTELKGSCASKLLNRCIDCPIHCRPGARLDLTEFYELKKCLQELADRCFAKRSAEDEKRFAEERKKDQARLAELEALQARLHEAQRLAELRNTEKINAEKKLQSELSDLKAKMDADAAQSEKIIKELKALADNAARERQCAEQTMRDDVQRYQSQLDKSAETIKQLQQDLDASLKAQEQLKLAKSQQTQVKPTPKPPTLEAPAKKPEAPLQPVKVEPLPVKKVEPLIPKKVEPAKKVEPVKSVEPLKVAEPSKKVEVVKKVIPSKPLLAAKKPPISLSFGPPRATIDQLQSIASSPGSA